MATGDKSQRIEYVDRMRGAAVFTMFLVHSASPWLLPEVNKGTYGHVISQISGMVAPVFMFLAGVSIAIIAGKTSQVGRDAGRDDLPVRKALTIRALGVLAAGYGLNLAFWACRGFGGTWTRVLKVDILQCIGVGMILTIWLMWPKKGINKGALAGLIILVSGAQLSWRLPLTEWLHGGVAAYLAYVPKMSGFPVFPYAGWVALGALVGPHWLRATKDTVAERKFWAGLIAAALILLISSYGLKVILGTTVLGQFFEGLAVVRTTVHHFLYKMALLFALFGLARASAFALDRVRFDFLVLFGRTSLFAYCVHLILVYHLFSLFFRRSLTPVRHLLAVLSLAAVMFVLCWVWRRRSALSRALTGRGQDD